MCMYKKGNLHAYAHVCACARVCVCVHVCMRCVLLCVYSGRAYSYKIHMSFKNVRRITYTTHLRINVT